MKFDELTEEQLPLKELVHNLGIQIFLDNYFLLKATFINPETSKPAIFVSMSETVEETLNAVNKYLNCQNFSGFIYRIKHDKAIPIMLENKTNIKDWK